MRQIFTAVEHMLTAIVQVNGSLFVQTNNCELCISLTHKVPQLLLGAGRWLGCYGRYIIITRCWYI